MTWRMGPIKTPDDHPTYQALKPLRDAHAERLATALHDGQRLRQ
ncbi:hypothetical protein [Streptomyces sp. NPDC020480]